MGHVFLVEHPRLPRKDALKLLDAGVSRNDDFKVRFQREADLLAQLSHPNIVTLHDRGEFEGRLWITMEYVDGTDAAELLRTEGPLASDLALELIGSAGAALDYAWRKQRITHRDVKPANILVGLDGDQIESVKLADFGIAKAAGEATSLTSTGVAIGTMQYISPEAIEGEPLDNRADVYSLGCTAFHLLTGRAPYSATSITALMSAHLRHDPPRISEVAPDLPAAMDPVFEKVLAKSPDERFQTCGDFVGALAEALGDEVGTPAFAKTMTAATMRTQVADQPPLVREYAAEGDGGRRKSRLVPVLAAVIAVLAIAAAVVGVLVARDSGDDATVAAAPSTTTVTTTATRSAPPSSTEVTTQSAVETTEPETTTATPTVVAEPEPYEGKPCGVDEFNEVSADGTLYCSAMDGAWRDRTHQTRAAVTRGSPCTEPGARARIYQTDAIATCRADSSGGYTWQL